MIGSLLTTARFGWAAVSGVDAFADAIGRYTVRMVLSSHAVDEAAAHEIVSRAQGNVARDTGTLFGGIAASESNGTWTVTATAWSPRGRYDMNYAFLVEHGTQPGERGGRRGGNVAIQVGGRSRAGAFNPTTGRRLRVANANRISDRTHPGTKPQPFFYPAVDAVLGEREARLEQALPQDL